MAGAREFFISVEGRLRPEVEDCVEFVFNVFEEKGKVKIPRRYVGDYWGGGEFGSLDWYIRQAFNQRRNQVDVGKLWELCKNEPWQIGHPHYELMIISQDMYSGDTNFVFGSTSSKISWFGEIYPGSRISGCIVSLNRILKWYERWREATIGILMHELGHFYGLPSAKNPNFIVSIDDGKAKSVLDIGHCNRRDCIMEQVNVPGRLNLLEKVDFVVINNPNWFCEYDLKALEENLRNLYR
jgi:predicted Zn-dependent protease